jgi:hypothetical protein
MMVRRHNNAHRAGKQKTSHIRELSSMPYSPEKSIAKHHIEAILKTVRRVEYSFSRENTFQSTIVPAIITYRLTN